MEAVQGLFRGLLWRHSKADVAAELGLPEQTQWVSWLRFSAVESYFYQRQHAKCGARALAALRHWEGARSPQHAHSPDSAGTHPPTLMHLSSIPFTCSLALVAGANLRLPSTLVPRCAWALLGPSWGSLGALLGPSWGSASTTLHC